VAADWHKTEDKCGNESVPPRNWGSPIITYSKSQLGYFRHSL